MTQHHSRPTLRGLLFCLFAACAWPMTLLPFELSFDFFPLDLLSNDSSKAHQSIDKAKTLISSAKEEDRYEGTHLLQSLMQESSWKKLTPETQLHIVLLLASGYEKIQQGNEQVLLLQQQLKRPELAHYAIHVKAALIHAYLFQKEMKEADALMKQLLSLSQKSLSTQEKKAIALACVLRDQALFSMIREAKEYLSQGKFQKASFLLEKVAATLAIEPIPCQSSPLSKKKVRFSVLLSYAECALLLGKNTLVLETTDSLLKEEPLLSPYMRMQALLLRDMAQGKYPQEKIAKLASMKPEYAPFCLLWQIQYSFFRPSSGVPTAPFSHMLSPLLLHYRQAIDALQAGNAPEAVRLFQEKLSEALLSHRTFKKQYLESYQEALWLRAVLCLFVEKKDALENTLSQAYALGDLIDEAQLPSRKRCFQTLHCLHRQKTPTPEILTASPAEKPHATTLTLLSLLSSKQVPPTSSLSLADRLFLTAVATSLRIQDTLEPTQLSPGTTPIGRFFTLLHQIQEGSFEWSSREGEVHALLQEASLEDMKPKLLHLLLTHSLSQQPPPPTLVSLFQQFVQESQGYSRRREAFVEYFLQSPLSDNKHAIVEELLNPPCDKWSVFLLIHLHRSGLLPRYQYPLSFSPFLQILHTLDQAKSFWKEATKTQETGQRTDRIRHALESFQTADRQMKQYLRHPRQEEEQAIALGLLSTMLSEWSELLFSEIVSEHPFLDLDIHLQQSLFALQSTSSFLSLLPTTPDFAYTPTIKQEMKELTAATQLFLQTFQQHYEEALALLRTLPPESFFLSAPTIRSILYLVQSLRKKEKVSLAWPLIKQLNEGEIKQLNQELALQVAIEKSLCLKEKDSISQAMSCLAWVINDSAPSSLRIKAMVLRADLYMQLKRPELAIRQLEAAEGKGGEWGQVATRKLRALQEEWQGMPVIIRTDKPKRS